MPVRDERGDVSGNVVDVGARREPDASAETLIEHAARERRKKWRDDLPLKVFGSGEKAQVEAVPFQY